MNESNTNSELSVVIPTLGGSGLRKTVEIINGGSVIPEKIFFVIPEKYKENIDMQLSDNVSVLVVDCMGQVPQRAEGFKHAKTKYVLQMDDDIVLDGKCIETLINTIKTYGESCSIAPIIINSNPVQHNNKKTIFHKLYYFLMNGKAGYQPGKIDKCGTPIAFRQQDVRKVMNVDWVPGGCILHQKNNLYYENYYPFNGRATYEDILHSYLLKQKGVELYLDPNAIAYAEINEKFNYTPAQYFKRMKDNYKVRKYYMNLASVSSMRIYLFYLINTIGYFISYFRNNAVAKR